MKNSGSIFFKWLFDWDKYFQIITILKKFWKTWKETLKMSKNVHQMQKEVFFANSQELFDQPGWFDKNTKMTTYSMKTNKQCFSIPYSPYTTWYGTSFTRSWHLKIWWLLDLFLKSNCKNYILGTLFFSCFFYDLLNFAAEKVGGT